MNQVQVSDQVGRRNVVPGNGHRPIERAADPVELEALAIALEQLRDDQLADEGQVVNSA